MLGVVRYVSDLDDFPVDQARLFIWDPQGDSVAIAPISPALDVDGVVNNRRLTAIKRGGGDLGVWRIGTDDVTRLSAQPGRTTGYPADMNDNGWVAGSTYVEPDERDTQTAVWIPPSPR